MTHKDINNDLVSRNISSLFQGIQVLGIPKLQSVDVAVPGQEEQEGNTIMCSHCHQKAVPIRGIHRFSVPTMTSFCQCFDLN